MSRLKFIVLTLVMAAMLTGCYNSTNTKKNVFVSGDVGSGNPDTLSDEEEQTDSINDAFYNKHHYAQNYNFVVTADSLPLLRQQPEELLVNLPTDTITVYHNDRLVVVDFRLLKNDAVDSVWIEVARDQYTFGWVREKHLLKSTVPDDPISQFILTFSNVHLLISLIIISVIAIGYLFFNIRKKKAKVVHFNDIDSFYPTLLAISVASAATFYSSIQMFAPETWQHFYYHPSLNPFAVPPILSAFLVSVWAMVIMTIATIDDVYHKLSPAHATLYLSGLAALCSANYIIFSITTLYYVGYILLLAYIFYAVKRYVANNYFSYICGKCGAKLTHKGRCPHCGTLNT